MPNFSLIGVHICIFVTYVKISSRRKQNEEKPDILATCISEMALENFLKFGM